MLIAQVKPRRVSACPRVRRPEQITGQGNPVMRAAGGDDLAGLLNRVGDQVSDGAELLVFDAE